MRKIKIFTQFEQFAIILDKRFQLTPDGSHCIRSLHCDRLVEKNQIAESFTVGPANRNLIPLSGKVALIFSHMFKSEINFLQSPLLVLLQLRW